MAEKKDKGKSKDKKDEKSKASAIAAAKPITPPPVKTVPNEPKPVVAEASPLPEKPAAKKEAAKTPEKPATDERALASKKKVDERTAAMEELKRRAAIRAAETAEARRIAWEKHREETAAKVAEREAKMKEAAEARRTEREKARLDAEKLRAEKAAQAKATRDAKLAEREQARAEARQKQLQAAAARVKAPVPTAAKTPKPVAKSTPAAKSQAEPVAVGLGIAMPAAVQKALDKSLKAAAKSTQDQVLGYLKISADADARLKSKLELQRKKIAKALEDSISAVMTKVLADPLGERPGMNGLTLNPKSSRALISYPELTLQATLKRGLQAAMRDLTHAITGEESATKHFSGLATPVMLQFFGDLETGQQLDGSLVLTLNLEKPDTSKLQYAATLGGRGKKSKEPVLTMSFEHDLTLEAGKGTFSASVVIQIPEEAPKI